jgi:CHASE3 domain sensor protein
VASLTDELMKPYEKLSPKYKNRVKEIYESKSTPENIKKRLSVLKL